MMNNTMSRRLAGVHERRIFRPVDLLHDLVHILYDDGSHELLCGNATSGVHAYSGIARLKDWAATTPYYDGILPEVFHITVEPVVQVKDRQENQL